MTKFKLVVISPTKRVLEADCDSVTLPTTEGQITVLPHHAAIFSLLSPGEVIVRSGSAQDELSLAVGGGFVNVDRNQVTLLAEFGVRSEELDEQKVIEAKRRAEEILATKTDEKESASARATLARSILELKVSQKRKKS